MSEFSDWVAKQAAVLREVQPSSWHAMDPEMMTAVGAYVQREYGHAGYGVRCLAGDRSGCVFVICATDGSEVRVYADRYGNVARVPDATT